MDVEKVKLYNELTLDTLMHEIIIVIIIFFLCLFVCMFSFFFFLPYGINGIIFVNFFHVVKLVQGQNTNQLINY